MKRRIEAGVLVALVAVLTFGCSPEVPDINVSQIVNNIIGGSGGTGPTPEVPGVTPDHVNLGCFGMVDPSGVGPEECGANLADWVGGIDSKGTLDATPIDAQGLKISGLSVQQWEVVPKNGPCSITGEQTGPDGFNPEIEITDVGCCAITVTVAGVVGGPRKFCGQ